MTLRILAVQGLQGFAFFVVNINDEQKEPRFKRKLEGLNVNATHVLNCI